MCSFSKEISKIVIKHFFGLKSHVLSFSQFYKVESNQLKVSDHYNKLSQNFHQPWKFCFMVEKISPVIFFKFSTMKKF